MDIAAVIWCWEHRGFNLCSTSHRETKRNMRHKMNSHGQGLAILYPIKIWVNLGKGIKRAMEWMGTRNRRRAKSCNHHMAKWWELKTEFCIHHMVNIWQFFTLSKFGSALERASKEPWRRWELKTEGLNIHPFGPWHINSQQGQKFRAEKPLGLQIMLSGFSSQMPECWWGTPGGPHSTHKKVAGKHQCRLV